MAKPPVKTSKTSKTKAGVLFRRNWVVIAIAVLWAAAHQPEQLDSSSLLVWCLKMLTVVFVIRAAFAILEPLVKLAVNLALQGISPHPPPEDGL
jgi:hypothetical protein